MCTKAVRGKQAGMTLIELIMFIVIVGIGVAGILSVINLTTVASADPLIHKQALAIAESLMEEITLQAFTFCAPGDTSSATATSVSDCAGSGQDGSVLPIKSRYSTVAPFDQVADYDGFSMNTTNGGIRNIANEPTGQAGYAVTVAVRGQGLPAVSVAPAIAAQASLLVVVTVTGPDDQPITLESFRTRYAPNGLP